MEREAVLIIKHNFAEGLAMDGPFWLLGRPSTFADMILFCRRPDGSFTQEDIRQIVCWCLKYGISQDLSFKQVATLADQNILEWLQQSLNGLFDKALEIVDQQKSSAFASTYELNSLMSYLKVVNQLKLDIDFDKLISQFLTISLALMVN